MGSVFEEMRAKWPSSIVARTEVKTLTGGAVSAKSLANMDSLGIGPNEKIVVNGKVCYPVESFLSWLEKRSRKN